MLDNSAQRIMGSSNGITHVDKAALGQLFAVLVLLFCKVQVIHGLCIQPGIIKRRAHLIRDRGQGLALQSVHAVHAFQRSSCVQFGGHHTRTSVSFRRSSSSASRAPDSGLMSPPRQP